MAAKKPVVLGNNGKPQQQQPADSLDLSTKAEDTYVSLGGWGFLNSRHLILQ